MSEDVLKVYFSPVKGLAERMKQLEDWKEELTKNESRMNESRATVAAHLVGSSASWYTISGVITYWQTSSPSFLLGGITYSNGALTIPSDGSYSYHSGDKTKHAGLLEQLKKGDVIDIHGGGSRHRMGFTHSVFVRSVSIMTLHVIMLVIIVVTVYDGL
ncbi:uncharacterized protein LOC134184557 [Corticium candelabrum]|uniref:uncharacterized protein LOC134184557 n=1 Tax=Corticium candelabrum TaxID=121492 RepID=UPI002E34C9DD|nr:uncharacterized protein LOC134184557 [Corticium candelabrum]